MSDFLANPVDAYRLYASRRPIGYDDSLSPWENAWRRLSPAERAWKWTP